MMPQRHDLQTCTTPVPAPPPTIDQAVSTSKPGSRTCDFDFSEPALALHDQMERARPGHPPPRLTSRKPRRPGNGATSRTLPLRRHPFLVSAVLGSDARPVRRETVVIRWELPSNTDVAVRSGARKRTTLHLHPSHNNLQHPLLPPRPPRLANAHSLEIYASAHLRPSPSAPQRAGPTKPSSTSTPPPHLQPRKPSSARCCTKCRTA
ncbi:hypothetical protein BAUCODRAFT_380762 [Baudoinia panamericana UAMH 10762]|uniref:Uncharacterized protein n=1 Tax=Baudoinia panamericana (strain UAMH 10762) TaxID=717646 RepID=M2NI87_BAUPA|nr:uncharacterized protein BAUCODRAFT_380762 [Baudoinia panamericana UAMH 10762]EMC98805.1 hypothetical protein BAUCODRAFT_380762 [Baudoinia panamericana UAMH 10762]